MDEVMDLIPRWKRKLALTLLAILCGLVGLATSDLMMVRAYRAEEYGWVAFQAALAALNVVGLGLNAWALSLYVRLWWLGYLLARARRRPHG